MIFGDLPPYEAFPIGGTNSVRGYSEGGVGSGRNYVAGTAELHWPLVKPVEVRPTFKRCAKATARFAPLAIVASAPGHVLKQPQPPTHA